MYPSPSPVSFVRVIFFLMLIFVALGFLLSTAVEQHSEMNNLYATITAINFTNVAIETRTTSTIIPTVNTTISSNQPTQETPTATPTRVLEPPEIAAARVTTFGIIIVGILSLLGVGISTYGVIQSAKILSKADKN